LACAPAIGGIAVGVGAVTVTAGAQIDQSVAVSSAIGVWKLTWLPNKETQAKR
jgi:hypothetical protein